MITMCKKIHRPEENSKLFLTHTPSPENQKAVLHPDVLWYPLNGMGAQKMYSKKLLQHFFQVYFIHKSNDTANEYLKTKIFFKGYIYPIAYTSLNASNIKYFSLPSPP